MSDSVSAQDTTLQFPWGREPDSREQTRHDALTAELQVARAREKAWLREKSDLLRRQHILAQEFEHRFLNSLQIIGGLLSLQSQAASPEAAEQLIVAARRVASFANVHRRLHLLDHLESVEFKQYLQNLCEDLSGLLFEGETGCTIAVKAAKIDIPTLFAIPLALIVNELITNSAKYARSNIQFDWKRRRPAAIRFRYPMTGRDCRRNSIRLEAKVSE
jgi:two-component sensor histidine kinase